MLLSVQSSSILLQFKFVSEIQVCSVAIQFNLDAIIFYKPIQVCLAGFAIQFAQFNFVSEAILNPIQVRSMLITIFLEFNFDSVLSIPFKIRLLDDLTVRFLP